MARAWFVLLLLFSALAPRAFAQQPDTVSGQPTGAVHGVVTTQDKSVPLAGVVVSILASGGEVASAVTGEDGSFVVPAIPPGAYSVVAVVQGFEALTVPANVVAGQQAEVALDLKIAAMAETVDVVAPVAVVPSTGTLTASEGLTSRQLDELGGPGGLQSALRLLASVIEVPGGVSIKGGRPSQATVQLGPGAFVDPATGLSQVSLPDDAIDKVTVLPNPYAVEYGRFSSGLVLIQTRRASDQWQTRLNKLEPSFRTERGKPFNVVGISALSPRFETGGPLIANKLFLQESAQYRYRTSDVASRPQSELKTSHRFSSFTRLDANASPRHLLVGTVGLFPASASQATLGTFTPPDASVNMWGNVTTGSLTERSLWSDTVFSETTFEVHRYNTEVTPRGPSPMELLPETTVGNFFNKQVRDTDTYQLIETVSGTSQGEMLQLWKIGVDVLHSRYDGSSASRPLLIRRTDGTLARRLDFSPSTTVQAVNSTDLALFAQDRFQPNDRYYVEVGARLDRDGVIDRFNLTPRVGTAILLNASGTSVIRSGFGIFYERTPSAAGAFSSYESTVDTRYAPDGVTPLGPAVRFAQVMDPNLRTSRSATWDLGLDHRFNTRWALHVGVIDREGADELLVKEGTAPDGTPAHLLTSDGKSQYREIETSIHFTGGPGVDLTASYVRSRARADLNSFTTFYDNVLWPVVGENAYAPARTDAPHRLLVRGRATPVRNWLVVGTLDWRTGLPYSVVDDSLDFVGPRNDRRFPAYVRADLGLEHRLKIGKLKPWVGVRADNAFSSFLPSDVQSNITSPAFGTFYNTEYRQFRIQVRFEP